ncbi:hypothetical protein A3Q34_16165 [Colwellia sp. PAMC 20917]|nr:hypothetical protein A3Q34_16165 [Colwellia sp. PAMC 20917]
MSVVLIILTSSCKVLAWQSLGWKIADIIKEYDDKKSIKGNSDRKMVKKYFTDDKIVWFYLFIYLFI